MKLWIALCVVSAVALTGHAASLDQLQELASKLKDASKERMIGDEAAKTELSADELSEAYNALCQEIYHISRHVLFHEHALRHIALAAHHRGSHSGSGHQHGSGNHHSHLNGTEGDDHNHGTESPESHQDHDEHHHHSHEPGQSKHHGDHAHSDDHEHHHHHHSHGPAGLTNPQDQLAARNIQARALEDAQLIRASGAKSRSTRDAGHEDSHEHHNDHTNEENHDDNHNHQKEHSHDDHGHDTHHGVGAVDHGKEHDDQGHHNDHGDDSHGCPNENTKWKCSVLHQHACHSNHHLDTNVPFDEQYRIWFSRLIEHSHKTTNVTVSSHHHGFHSEEANSHHHHDSHTHHDGHPHENTVEGADPDAHHAHEDKDHNHADR